MGLTEKKAHIREVLLALGGSAEALDPENEKPRDEPSTLAWRVVAHTR